MTRYQLLAAEVFGYSYANYEDHLGIGNIRFEELMPSDAESLEKADAEGWAIEKVGKALKVDVKDAAHLLQAIRRAREVVDAENPAESFRNGVRQSIEHAIAEGLAGEAAIERLVTQICYRASDLGYLLQREKKPLSRYSRHLRREPNVEYYEGYFDEEDGGGN